MTERLSRKQQVRYVFCRETDAAKNTLRKLLKPEVIIISALNLVTEIGTPEAQVTFETKQNEKMQTRSYERSYDPFWCEEFDCAVYDGEEIIFTINGMKLMRKDIGSASFIVPHMVKGDVIKQKLQIDAGGILTIKIICNEVEMKTK